MPPDQEESMAIKRIAFGAQQRDSMSPRALDDSLDAGHEEILSFCFRSGPLAARTRHETAHDRQAEPAGTRA